MDSGAKDIEWGGREQHVWEMLGEGKTTSEIAEALGVDYWEASELSGKVFDARRTPNFEAIDAARERLRNLRFA